jgi:hypothetical protein
VAFLGYLAAGLALLLLLLLLSAGWLAEQILERRDTQWLGTELSIERLHLGLLSGKLELRGLELMEPGTDRSMLSLGALHTRVHLPALLQRRLLVPYLELESPRVFLSQRGAEWNFSPLLRHLSGGQADTAPAGGKPLAYELRDVSLSGGGIRYTDLNLEHTLQALDWHFACPLLSSEQPLTAYSTAFKLAGGGALRAALQLDHSSLEASAQLDIDSLQLNQALAYARPYLHLSAAEGLLHTGLRYRGSFADFNRTQLAGSLQVQNLHIQGRDSLTLASLGRLSLRADSLDLTRSVLNFNELILEEPYLKLEVYPQGDNLSALMRSTGASPETLAGGAASEELGALETLPAEVPGSEYGNLFVYLAQVVNRIASTYLQSEYSAERIAIRDGALDFADFSLPEPFRASLDSLQVEVRQFDTQQERVSLDLSARINGQGLLRADWSLDPHDPLEMDLRYVIEHLPVWHFNPYATHYAAHPVLRGDLHYDGSVSILKRQLDSRNQVLLEKVQVGRRMDSPAAANLPLRLAVALLSDLKGNIRLDIPITGQLDDPHYRLGKVIVQVLKNLVLKAVTSPFRLLAGLFDGDEQALRELPFRYGQRALNKEQQRSLEKLRRVLENKPGLLLEYSAWQHRGIGRENLALDSLRWAYYAHSGFDGRSASDSARVYAIAPTDSAFLVFLAGRDPQAQAMASPQQRAVRAVGQPLLNRRLTEAQTRFEQSMREFLLQGGLDASRVRAATALPPETPDSSQAGSPRYLFRFDVLDDAASP